jgi:hypothetical protein
MTTHRRQLAILVAVSGFGLFAVVGGRQHIERHLEGRLDGINAGQAACWRVDFLLILFWCFPPVAVKTRLDKLSMKPRARGPSILLGLSIWLTSEPTSPRTCYFVAGAALSKRYDYAPHSLVVVDCHRHLGARLESRGDHVGKGNDHENLDHDHILPIAT